MRDDPLESEIDLALQPIPLHLRCPFSPRRSRLRRGSGTSPTRGDVKGAPPPVR